MNRDRPSWYDDDAGPLVRPYAVSRGRTRPPAPGLDLITLILTVEPAARAERLTPECAEILLLCRSPLSIAEISAALALPVAVVKILVSDLLDENLVVSRSSTWRSDIPDRELLEAVLHGLRRL